MKMRSPVAAAFAIGLGVVVLIGYFIPAGTSSAGLAGLLSIRTIFIDSAVTLAGFATLVAILGLVSTHWHKLRAKRNPDRYSIFMLLGFIITFGMGVLAYLLSGTVPGLDVPGFQTAVSSIQVPVEASLMAVLAVTLTLASLRLFQRRKGLMPVVFVISVLVYLLFNSGLLAGSENIPFVGDILTALQILPVAGGRGILMGIALGSLMAGLRILLGADRPYSG